MESREKSSSLTEETGTKVIIIVVGGKVKQSNSDGFAFNKILKQYWEQVYLPRPRRCGGRCRARGRWPRSAWSPPWSSRCQSTWVCRIGPGCRPAHSQPPNGSPLDAALAGGRVWDRVLPCPSPGCVSESGSAAAAAAAAPAGVWAWAGVFHRSRS